MSLIKPKKLETGDKIAVVSLSWGGPGRFRHRYEAGKRQFIEAFGLEVIEMPHALKDASWIHNNPKARADDLMLAFSDSSIKGIIFSIAGPLIGGCIDVFPMVLGTSLWPSKEAFKGSIFFVETSGEVPPVDTVKRIFRNLGVQGILSSINAVLIGRPSGTVQDIENMRFNTAIAKMMEFVNVAKKEKQIPKSVAEKFVLILSTFAPHLGEELWSRLGHTNTLAYETWPKADKKWFVSDEMTIVIAINGKCRADMTIIRTLSEEEIKKLAETEIANRLSETPVKKVIYIKNKLVNFIV